MSHIKLRGLISTWMGYELSIWRYTGPIRRRNDRVSRHKAIALLIFLAIPGEHQSRESLKTMF